MNGALKRRESPSQYAEALQDIRVLCPRCGHTAFIPVQMDKQECTHCRYNIPNKSKAYFKYQLNKRLKGEKKEC